MRNFTRGSLYLIKYIFHLHTYIVNPVIATFGCLLCYADCLNETGRTIWRFWKAHAQITTNHAQLKWSILTIYAYVYYLSIIRSMRNKKWTSILRTYWNRFRWERHTSNIKTLQILLITRLCMCWTSYHTQGLGYENIEVRKYFVINITSFPGSFGGRGKALAPAGF